MLYGMFDLTSSTYSYSSAKLFEFVRTNNQLRVMNVISLSTHNLQSDLEGCEKGFVNIFLRVPQAVGPVLQLHFCKERGTLRKMFTICTFFTTCRNRMYNISRRSYLVGSYNNARSNDAYESNPAGCRHQAGWQAGGVWESISTVRTKFFHLSSFSVRGLFILCC